MTADEFRQAAEQMFVTYGFNQYQLACQLGIFDGTLVRWKKVGAPAYIKLAIIGLISILEGKTTP